ncbi:hypothetical protein DM02DRAFT_565225 [Periconia macrospinosa]|uniref:Uncharacterized protein n=1 Tax=Periconia macrospinosa TaxID=97972 RepID=A0A2V1DLR4_9PLEO|nr:hypothetical protein DM02DRAFT_565225 [Periconia macrospinosa]
MRALGISVIRTAPRIHRGFLLRLSTIPTRKSSTSANTQPSKRLYPGLGYDVRAAPQYDREPYYPIGSHPNAFNTDSELLPVRELAMMSIMDKLTDKPDWHKKIFNDSIVDKWRKEALAIPNCQYWKLADSGEYALYNDIVVEPEGIMDSDSFDYCVQELRAKASYFEKTGLIPTLDAAATVVKSDCLVAPELQKSLQQSFEKLKNEQAAQPDWHPGSNDTVQDLVHPSMYPLVYNRSMVLRDELVGVEDAIEWAGKGELIVNHAVEKTEEPFHLSNWDIGGLELHPELWSDKYQWLPSNLTFREDGTVKFTSYINNLHPTRHKEIYRTIEKLIDTALPAWEQCLIPTGALEGSQLPKKAGGPGRTKGRFGYFEDPDDANPKNWIITDPEIHKSIDKYTDSKGERWDSVYDDDSRAIDRRARIPPPPPFQEINYTPNDRLRLAKRFAKSGLQVIVKMASIELTPDKPSFSGGNWHIEGQMNELIAATALYYTSSTNITPSNLSFRMQTDPSLNNNIVVGQDAYHWMGSIYGAYFGCDGSSCLQNYGHVETKQGRLLAFPNMFQHCVSPFEIVDKENPGSRSFVALWLVDPHRRILSTANVPPLRMDWMEGCLEEGEGMDGADGVRPMTVEEAREHRGKLMKERTNSRKVAEDGWLGNTYHFCEH